MKRVFTFILLGTLISSACVPTVPSPTAAISQTDTYWIKAIGGEDRRKMNYAPSVIVEDDGYVWVGYSDAFGAGNLDFLIVKLDKDGGLLWSRAIGGPQKDEAYTIEKTPDGGYFIAGFTELSHERPETGDVVALKLRSDLSLEWAKTIGTIPGSAERAFSGRRTEDGGYVITAATDLNDATSKRDVLIVKLNAGGGLEWAKTIGGPRIDHGSGIIRTQDGGYAIAGLTHSGGAGGQDALVLKLDKDGDLEWAKAIGGPGLESDNWDGIRQTQDGGFVIGGATKSFGVSNEAFYFAKLQSDGSLEWAKVIDSGNRDACWTVTPTTDGGYIAGGVYESNPRTDPGNVLLVRLDKNANFLWATKLADSTFQEIEEVKEIESGYVIAGVTNSLGLHRGDFLVAKLDTTGLVPGSGYTTRITPNIVSAPMRVTPLSLTATDVTSQVKVNDFQVEVIIPTLRIDTLAGVP